MSIEYQRCEHVVFQRIRLGGIDQQDHHHHHIPAKDTSGLGQHELEALDELRALLATVLHDIVGEIQQRHLALGARCSKLRQPHRHHLLILLAMVQNPVRQSWRNGVE